MATTLQTLLTRINSVNDNTSLKDLLLLTKDVELYDATKRVYDSAGTLPLDSAFVGSMLMTQQNTFYTLSDVGGLVWTQVYQAPSADSIGPSFVPISPPPLLFGGTNYGYASGNQTPNNGNIQSYSFVSDGNGTNVTTMTVARYNQYGMSSEVSGYNFGGYPSPTGVIDKFSFASNGASTSVGTGATMYGGSGGAHSSKAYAAGYAHGSQTGWTLVHKNGFAADGNSTSLGTIRSNIAYPNLGNQTQEVGYTAGGLTLPAGVNNTIIDKFPFSTETVTSNVGALTVARRGSFATSSTEYGYTAGGYVAANSNVIDKFPFAADGNATDVGDLTITSLAGTSSSSTTYGYSASSGSPGVTAISKYSFTSDGNATSVGTLAAQANHGAQGQQY